MNNLLRGIQHTLAAVTTNCSEFQNAWANATPQARWQGEWHSETNQHHGQLRAVLLWPEPTHLRAFVHARYARIMRVCYTIDLHSEHLGNELHLEGEADLGELAGGIYRYDGVLGANQFKCRYECKYDRGEFQLAPISPSKSDLAPQ